MSDGQWIGAYRVERRLGEGGMAEVFLVRKDGPGGLAKRCVLKRIRPENVADPEFRRLFLREAALALNLRHPNLVQIYGYEEIDGEPALVMEYVEGITLAEFSSLRWDASMLVEAARQILEGLHYLHSHDDGPILHRDLSPANVMVDGNGVVKLLDFGVSRLRPTIASGKTELRGTWRYAAPERKSGGAGEVSGDLFSLGLLLLDLALGDFSQPVDTEDLLGRRLEYLEDPEVRSFFKEVTSWLSFDPSRRPGTEEALARLSGKFSTDSFQGRQRLSARSRSILAGETVQSTSAARATRRLPSSRSGRRNHSKIAISILAVFLVLMFLAVGVRFLPSLRIGSSVDIAPRSPLLDPFPAHLSLLPVDARPDRTVRVDGRHVGRTPLVLTLSPGRHEILFDANPPKSDEISRIVHLAPGPNAELFIKN